MDEYGMSLAHESGMRRRRLKPFSRDEHMLKTSSTVLIAAALLSAPLAAQNGTYLSNPGTTVASETFRARNTSNGNGGDRLYAGLASSLGNGSLRDSYTGTWDNITSRTFSLRYYAAHNILRFSVSGITFGAGLNDGTTLSALLNDNTVKIYDVGSFNALRIFGRAAGATLTKLDFGAGNVLTGAEGGIGNTEQFWALSDASDFLVTGELTPTRCSNESCRFEIGVATAANVVPEPSTYALMATGLAGLIGVARRRARA